MHTQRVSQLALTTAEDFAPALDKSSQLRLELHTSEVPRFSFNKDQAPHLVMDSGFLFYASGNDSLEYAEGCQLDYLTQHSLQNRPSLVFVRSVEQADQYYQQACAAVEQYNRLDDTAFNLGIKANTPQLNFLVWEPQGEKSGVINLQATQELAARYGYSAEWLVHAALGAEFNQFSKLQTDIFESLASAQLPYQDPISGEILTNMRAVSNLVEPFNDKSRYVALIRGIDGLPRHVESVLLNVQELTAIAQSPNPWETLTQRLGTETAEALFIKSALDAGGEGAALITETGCSQALSDLLEEVCQKERPMLDNKFLVQRVIDPSQSGDLPMRIGINASIRHDGTAGPIEVTGQIYTNSDRTDYLGSTWDKTQSEHITDQIGKDRIEKLLEVFSKAGYRGPIGFDAMFDKDGYTFIYDCNPRLSASSHVKTVRNIINRSTGIEAEAVVSFGHHGQWQFDSVSRFTEKAAQEGLCFSSKSGKGLLLLPNANGQGRYDIFAVNLRGDDFARAVNFLLAEASVQPKGEGIFL